MIAVGDSTGELAYANKRFLDFLGMTIEELSAASLQTIHPDDRERIGDEWRRCQAVGQSMDVVQRLMRFDGVYRWVHVRVYLFRDERGRIVQTYGGTRTSTINGGRNRRSARARKSFVRSSTSRLCTSLNLDLMVVVFT